MRNTRLTAVERPGVRRVRMQNHCSALRACEAIALFPCPAEPEERGRGGLEDAESNGGNGERRRLQLRAVGARGRSNDTPDCRIARDR
jgi:hypothetical protein